MDQKKTGYFFKILRSEKQLTQEQLAERFNVSSQYIYVRAKFFKAILGMCQVFCENQPFVKLQLR